MSTPQRTLDLLGLLQRQRDWSGADLSDRLEVSPRTLRRDIDRLRMIGYPIESTPGVDGGYRMAPGATLPPLVLGDDAAVALVVALRTAAHTSIGGASELAVQVLSKVMHVLPSRLRRRADAVSTMTDLSEWSTGEPADLNVLTAVADAAMATVRVEMDYRDRVGNDTVRIVEPARLVLQGRRWYLVAYDTDRHDWRTFRVDRIGAVRSTGKRFVPKPIPGGDAVAYLQASMGEATVTHRVEFVVDVPADQVVERFGRWCEVTPLDDLRCRVVCNIDTFEWPMMMLASLDAPFEIVGDEAFRRFAARFGVKLAGTA